MSQSKAISTKSEDEQVVTPFDVQGATVNGVVQDIDYTKLINQFGTKVIDPVLLARFAKLVKERGHDLHPFLFYGIFFTHRNLEVILENIEKGKPFYLYTGRGPSSESMHLGHLVPFRFCKYLQDVFDVPLVIQMTDDEKYLYRNGLTLEQTHAYAFSNAKDIMAVGFNPKKTFIFSNLDFMGGAFYSNVVKISRHISFNDVRSTFGLTESDAVGKIHFVAVQAAPSFSSTFPNILPTNPTNPSEPLPCLIPCAIDQDPYFRLTRDVAPKLGELKPCLIHAQFFPALQGAHGKMSASAAETAVLLTDKPADVKRKINKYAFSGGKDTLEEHRRLGGDCGKDVAFQYLKFFLQDGERLHEIQKAFESGEMTSGELKAECIKVLNEFLDEFQARRAKVTDEDIKQVMAPRPLYD